MAGAAAVSLVLLALLLWGLDPRRTWARLVALAVLQYYVIAYWLWRASATLPDLAISFPSLWQWLFFAVESLATLFLCWTAVILTRHKDNTALADERERQLRASCQVPRVSVLIPTFHEPLAVLDATIRAAMAIEYPDFEVLVLDDDKGPDGPEGRVHAGLEELCRDRGARYLRRTGKDHAKAGNLNFGLSHSDGEVVLVLDADFQAQPTILMRTVGLLDGETALVQTPQHYYSPDPIQHNLGGSKAWTEEQRFFFDVAIPAREAWGNAICVGTSFVVSRAALGPQGFATGCLSEDVYGGYALAARGWRLRYLNEPLSFGAAADSIVEYVRQRTRWCRGIIQAIWLPHGPLRARGLRLIDRLLYLEMPLYWISQFGFLALMLIAPAVWFWTGVPVFESRLDDATANVLPRAAAAALVTAWISGGRVLPVITDVGKLVATWYIVVACACALIRPNGGKFEPTNKGQARTDVIVNWHIMRPFLGIGLVTVAGIVQTLSGNGPVPWNEFLVPNLLLGMYVLLLLALACAACVDWPKPALVDDRAQPLRGRWWASLAILLLPRRRSF